MSGRISKEVIPRECLAEPPGPSEFDNRSVADEGWEVVATDDPFRPFRVKAAIGSGKGRAKLSGDGDAWLAVLDGAGRGDPRHAMAVLFLAHGSPAELQAMRDHRDATARETPGARSTANLRRLDVFVTGLVLSLAGGAALSFVATFVGFCLASFAAGARSGLPYVALFGIGAVTLAAQGLCSHLANRRWGIFE